MDCQAEVHKWGRANRVTFDASKESFHVISRVHPYGDNFKLLGISFDAKLLMHDAVHQCAVEASWRLTALLRTRRFYSFHELVSLYKSQVLSFIEFRTAGLAHAASSVLDELDSVHRRFLHQVGLDDRTALLHFNLAPLSTRRDLALLAVIHRTVLGHGPPHFRDYDEI